MPFTVKTDLALHREGEHLIVRIGSFKRHIPLPRELIPAKVKSAKIEEGWLRVRFES